jgi:hypothetical protein
MEVTTEVRLRSIDAGHIDVGVYAKTSTEEREWLFLFNKDREHGDVCQSGVQIAASKNDCFDDAADEAPIDIKLAVTLASEEVLAIIATAELTEKIHKEAGEIVRGLSLTIHCPNVFQIPEFVEWLNNGSPKMTWHQGGKPAEFSDVVVRVDPSLNGEGSDSDMPSAVWDFVVQECRNAFYGAIQPGMPHIQVCLVNV